jgi:uncharacterized protein YndB with AHSA1/START domain
VLTVLPDKPVKITSVRRYAAPPDQVFNAWFDAERAGEWLFATPGGEMLHVTIDGRIGGGFTIVERRGDEEAAHFGVFTEIKWPSRLAFTFSTSKDEAGSPVTIEIERYERGSVLTLTHTLAPPWAAHSEQISRSWLRMLLALEQTLLSGTSTVTPPPAE